MLAWAGKRLADPEVVVALVADWADDGDLDEPGNVALVEALGGAAKAVIGR